MIVLQVIGKYPTVYTRGIKSQMLLSLKYVKDNIYVKKSIYPLSIQILKYFNVYLKSRKNICSLNLYS